MVVDVRAQKERVSHKETRRTKSKVRDFLGGVYKVTKSTSTDDGVVLTGHEGPETGDGPHVEEVARHSRRDSLHGT